MCLICLICVNCSVIVILTLSARSALARGLLRSSHWALLLQQGLSPVAGPDRPGGLLRSSESRRENCSVTSAGPVTLAPVGPIGLRSVALIPLGELLCFFSRACYAHSRRPDQLGVCCCPGPQRNLGSGSGLRVPEQGPEPIYTYQCESL